MANLSELKQNISQLIEEHQELLELARQKQNVLVEGNTPELPLLISKETKKVEKILRLETEREQLMKAFLGEEDFTQLSLDTAFFIGKLSEPESIEWFTTALDQLKDVVFELSYINQNNQALIHMSLDYLQYSINILMPRDQEIGYGKGKASFAKLLDAKI